MPPRKKPTSLPPLSEEKKKEIEAHRNALIAAAGDRSKIEKANKKYKIGERHSIGEIVAARKSVPKSREDEAAEGLLALKGMKKGGLVKETKPHLLHKGEVVIPASLAKQLHKLIMPK
jgi:hypothetical protein